MVVPEVDIDQVVFRRVRSPQLPRRETDAIAMLRRLALAVRIRVGEDEHAMVAVDDAGAAADIAGNAGMAGRMDVARDHALSLLEPRRTALALGRAAAADDLRHPGPRDRRQPVGPPPR